MIRKEVFKFAEAMEEKLKVNEHKGHWKDCETAYLVDKLLEELSEFHRAILKGDEKAMRSEGADIANITMMIIDNYKEQVDKIMVGSEEDNGTTRIVDISWLE